MERRKRTGKESDNRMKRVKRSETAVKETEEEGIVEASIWS